MRTRRRIYSSQVGEAPDNSKRALNLSRFVRGVGRFIHARTQRRDIYPRTYAVSVFLVSDRCEPHIQALGSQEPKGIDGLRSTRGDRRTPQTVKKAYALGFANCLSHRIALFQTFPGLLRRSWVSSSARHSPGAPVKQPLIGKGACVHNTLA